MIARDDSQPHVSGAHRAARRRRYLSLGVGEWVAAVVFLGLTVKASRSSALGPALWSAMLPLLVILFQAGGYWLWARTWVMRRAMPRGAQRVFRACRVLDPALLIVGLVGVISWWPSRIDHRLLVLAVWSFGVIEYVNYYLVRLAYPARRWFHEVRAARTPQLIRDLRGEADVSRP